MEKSTVQQKIHSLQYMSPWVKNLVYFADPTTRWFDQSGARLRDSIRYLITLTLQDEQVRDHRFLVTPALIEQPKVYAMVQQYVWSEICKLDSPVVNIVLDELMRTAVDGSFGSRKSEVITDTVGTLSSINVRGRILSKLRKVGRRVGHVLSCCSIRAGYWQDDPQAHSDARGEPTLERNSRPDEVGPRLYKSMQASCSSAAFRARDRPPRVVNFVDRIYRDQAFRPRNSDEHAPNAYGWKEWGNTLSRDSDPTGRVCEPRDPSAFRSCAIYNHRRIRQLRPCEREGVHQLPGEFDSTAGSYT